MSSESKKISPLHNLAYPARLLLMIAAATLINITGLMLSQWLGYSVLFFDMIGTAAVSFVGGLPAGVITALMTGALGQQLLPNSDYSAFVVSNVIGAFVWALAPRTGYWWMGCDVFNVRQGWTYNKIFRSMLIVGLLAGIATSASSYFVEFHFLGYSQKILDGDIGDLSGIGTSSSENNVVLMKSLLEMAPKDQSLLYQIFLFATILLSHLPDKLVTTCIAIVMVLAWGSLPNYRFQKSFIKKQVADAQVVQRKGRLLGVIAMVSLLSFYIYNYGNGEVSGSLMTIMLLIILFLTVIVAVSDSSYIDTVDYNFPLQQGGTATDVISSEALYYLPEGFHYGRYKTAFEDLLKLTAIFVSASSVLLAEASVNGRCLAESLSGSSCSEMYKLAIANVLIVTGIRYFTVITMRFFDKS